MNILYGFWVAIQILIGYNLVMPIVLFIIYLIVGKSGGRVRKSVATFDNRGPDYGIIVTAYEQTDMLPNVVASLLQLKYDHYLIYIVADNCDISTLHFEDERVILLRPGKVLAGNIKSHFYAIDHFKRAHTHLTIIDSDNLVDPLYLQELNVYFGKGFEAVQGVRKAKNTNTVYATLDAARDMYYHFYDGEVLFKIGSSATLAGSGMAFTVQLYKDCLQNSPVEGAGFDKVLQAIILNKGLRIAFTEKAIVYDEKTSRSDQLVKQRARWINTWFKYFSYGFQLVAKGLRYFSWNRLLFGIILLRPPLFIFLGLSFFCMFINLWISATAVVLWLLSFVLFIAGFFIALAHAKADAGIYRALIGIPRFVFYQVLSLTKVKRANKYSVATKHYHDTQKESSPR